VIFLVVDERNSTNKRLTSVESSAIMYAELDVNFPMPLHYNGIAAVPIYD